MNLVKFQKQLDKSWFCDREGCVTKRRCDFCKLNLDLAKHIAQLMQATK